MCVYSQLFFPVLLHFPHHVFTLMYFYFHLRLQSANTFVVDVSSSYLCLLVSDHLPGTRSQDHKTLSKVTPASKFGLVFSSNILSNLLLQGQGKWVQGPNSECPSSIRSKNISLKDAG